MRGGRRNGTVTYKRTLITGVAVLALCCEVALAGCGSHGKKEVAFVEPKQEHSKAHARAGKAWRIPRASAHSTTCGVSYACAPESYHHKHLYPKKQFSDNHTQKIF